MRTRSFTRVQVVVFAALLIEAMMWALASLWEENAAIALIHAALLCSGLAVARSIDGTSVRIFAVALFARSFFSIAAWFLADAAERRFFIGTMDDPAKYWEAAMFPLAEARVYFEDPLFAVLNVVVTDISKFIDAPSYLATMQTVLFAGSLMSVFAYAFVRDLYGPKIGMWAGYLMAVSPSSLTFATGLLRDALIGMFGFLFLFAFNRAMTRRNVRARFWMTGLVVASAVALANLRSISLACFTIAGLLLVFSTTPSLPNRISRRVKLTVTFSLAGILLLAVLDRPDRFEADKVLAHAVASRSGDEAAGLAALDPNGITTKIGEVSPALFLLISPYALVQPLPFYSWQAAENIGGPPAVMDVVLGFGGLFNQLLFGFFIIGVRYWWVTKDTFGIRVCFFFTLLVCSLTLVGLGSTRMVMAHCFPFFYLGIGLAISKALQDQRSRVWGVLKIWSLALIALYSGYWMYRETGNGLTIGLGLIIAAMLARKIWRYDLLFTRLRRIPPVNRCVVEVQGVGTR